MRREQRVQLRLRLARACDGDEAAGRGVEAMGHERRAEAIGEPLMQRAVLAQARRLDRHARRLVDDPQLGAFDDDARLDAAVGALRGHDRRPRQLRRSPARTNRDWIPVRLPSTNTTPAAIRRRASPRLTSGASAAIARSSRSPASVSGTVTSRAVVWFIRLRRRAPSSRSIQWLPRLEAPAPDSTTRRHAAGVVLGGVDAREELVGRRALTTRWSPQQMTWLSWGKISG